MLAWLKECTGASDGRNVTQRDASEQAADGPHPPAPGALRDPKADGRDGPQLAYFVEK